jgi:hypothetical protein
MSIDPAILALAGAGVAQLIVVAFWAGILTARVRTLEKQIEPMLALVSGVATLEAELRGVQGELRLLNQSIGWLRQAGPREPAA